MDDKQLLVEAVKHLCNMLEYPAFDYPPVIEAYEFLRKVAKAHPEITIPEVYTNEPDPRSNTSHLSSA